MTSSQTSLSPEQIKAARALLAWSQQELAAEARVAVSTVADFERGVRTPVANNAQAIREALEAKGLQFIAGGVVEKAMLPSPPSLRAGTLMRWVNATHLSQWGERRDGQAGIPELLSRLIYATLGPAASLRFPSDESVQYPGWDGICAVTAGGGPIPAGESVWEIGAQRTAIRAKADKDFAKRSANPLGRNPRQTTFVFVTPQRFNGKDSWVAEKKALAFWRDVIAIDGDDLVHWLEMCPGVAQWLSVKIGRRPEGLRNMEEAWSEWVRATETPLTPDVVLTGRDQEQIAVLKWLRDVPQLLSIRAEAPDEALAFLYAAISPLPERYRLSYWSRCVVAETAETARQLVGLGTQLIIVITEPAAGLAQRLVDDGHHVFAAYGPGANDFVGALQLARPWKFDLQMALTRAGFSNEDAHRLAHASGRSITVLRRLMPAAPSYRASWAQPASPELVAAMFAGAWVETSARDRKIISNLAGQPYEDVEATLGPLAGIGGPLVRSGEVWKVVSLRDLWTQIGGQVTSSQLLRFEAEFQNVLSTVNPRYATRPMNIHYEAIGEFGDEPSGALRQGLTEALIALAVFPDRAGLITDVAGRASQTVRKLLEKASPALWWSLSRDFHNIAEAAPKAFLDALEAGLEGDDPSVMSLFRSDEGFLHPTEYLANLLWSLEMLARSPDYLMQAALILARLDDIDPGGRWGNRPSASLRRIFVAWSPQTYATPTQRLKVIDAIVRQLPAVGWKLLLALAPRSHDVSEPSSKPNWRDFSPDEPEVVTWKSVADSADAIGQRLLAHVKNNGERWRALLDFWPNFAPEWRTAATKQLHEFALGLSDPAEIEAMRDRLRALLDHHRGFKDAEWAIPETDLKPLDEMFATLQPVGVEDRVRWLFQKGAMTLRPNVDWNEQQAELEARQVEAAEALLAELSPERLLTFASTLNMAQALGLAIAKTAVLDTLKHSLMKQGLLASEPAEADVGRGILFGLKIQRGEGWVRELWQEAGSESWGDQAELRIVHHLPPIARTWTEIAARSAALNDAYWRTLPTYGIPDDADPTYVIERLLVVGRSRDAVAWLGHHVRMKPPAALVVLAMKAAARSDEPLQGNDASMFSHWTGVLLDYLEANPDVSEQQVVELEWAYFQALRYSQRRARTLHRALARDPDFFVYLLKLIFLPAEDSGVIESDMPDMESARKLASQAYDVLHDWSYVPGSDDRGAIDTVALENWVKRARKLLAESGRGEIGDSKIGEILSAAKREPDQPWPPEPVREILELVRSRTLERGFEIGVYNRRGVTVRSPHDGGAQERALAERYRRDVEVLRFDWPRTAACLDRIATTYETDANREDQSAEQRDWL
jgi:transcriptional regulator with XRE-family HTH domain